LLVGVKAESTTVTSSLLLESTPSTFSYKRKKGALY